MVRLEDEINNDPELKRYNIVLYARNGFRAAFLDAWDSLLVSHFTHCIIMCGNNDVSVHPRKRYPVETPSRTAARLISFHNFAVNDGVKTAVIGLFRRPDVDEALINDTNSYLKKYLLSASVQSYVGPRHVQPTHFDSNDRAHFTATGRKTVLALLLSVIKKRFNL